MWRRRLFPIFLALCGFALLTGAGSAPTDPTAPPAPPAAAAPDPVAVHVLDRVVESLGPDRLRWLRTDVWEKVQVGDFAYEAEGCCLLGPGGRVRLELQTRRGESRGDLLTVSDGKRVWQATRIGGPAWTNVARFDLPEARDAADGPAPSLQGPSFRGVQPLLSNLRERLTWVRHEAVRTDGTEQTLLTGVWPSGAAVTSAGQPWPAALPRQCRLFVDAASLWPRRVEWWGPATLFAGDSLLAQVEFRRPVRNHPLTAEQCARAFTFEGAASPVRRRTTDAAASLAP